jgi:hypothetical protein
MKITYRPEIDGLRAIAVSSVIFYHAPMTILGYQPKGGGFIGVDIFFVISGYLITSIILKELITTGSFSLKYFYERRVRRILPALLFVMLVSFPFAWTYLLPSSFIEFSKSILYSLGFASNFYFYFSGIQYGAESGLLKPFLHTWSLSVEEQFYILFPIILLIIFKYLRKYLIYTLIVGFIISLGLADYTSRNYQSISFYLIHTRMWELLAGSILAYFEITKGHRSKNKIFNLILPATGLFLIGHFILFFNDKIYHPSFYTLSPIIGVCLIIWFSNKDEIITKILSTKLFVLIGLTSYSLYLWHYPIFAYIRLNYFTFFEKFLLIIILFILSTFTYFFVEKISKNKKYKFKFIGLLILFFYFVLIFFNSNVILKNGYKNRLPQILRENFSEEKIWARLINREGEICHDNIRGCKFNVSSKKKVYLIGDSNTASLAKDLKDAIINRDYQFISYTRGSCMYVPGFDLVHIETRKINSTCNNNYFSELENELSKQTDAIVILGYEFLQNYLNNDSLYVSSETHKFDNIRDSIKISVEKILKTNKVIIIYPVPYPTWDITKIINNIIRVAKEEDNLGNNDRLLNSLKTSRNYTEFKNYTKESFKLLDSINRDNIYRVYPHILFCNTLIKNECIVHDNKNIFFVDSSHPSIKGSEIISNLIMKEIEKIESRSK